MNLNAIKKMATRLNVTVTDKGNGHIQLKGIILVNYYPDSKNQTAYIASTKKGFSGVTPRQAVRMATELPPKSEGKIIRKPQRRARKRLFKPGHVCHWCKEPLTLSSATVDHVVPLRRDGLDVDSNKVLACQSCNIKRGHDMPELLNKQE